MGAAPELKRLPHEIEMHFRGPGRSANAIRLARRIHASPKIMRIAPRGILLVVLIKFWEIL
jgi:hypothetical protein